MKLPVRVVDKPSSLDGQQNGKVAPDRMDSAETNGSVATFARPATTAWVALCEAAAAAGHLLVPFSTYRSYAKQEALFRARYSTTPKAGVDRKLWNGQVWYLHSGAVTAAPGTSNHGWGLAVDVRVKRNGMTRPIDEPALLWLLAGNALAHGFSWEIQSETWHLRYFAGDNPPTHPSTTEDDDMPSIEELKAAGFMTFDQYKARSGELYNGLTAQLGRNYNAILAGNAPADPEDLDAQAQALVAAMGEPFAEAVAAALEDHGYIIVKKPGD